MHTEARATEWLGVKQVVEGGVGHLESWVLCALNLPDARSMTMHVEHFFLRRFKLGYPADLICMPSCRILGS